MAELARQAEPLLVRGVISGRFILTEAAGSLGDLGTFVPIVVGMTHIVGLDAATVLVFAGLMNIFTGVAFGMPIAVQPMKAVAALAIAGMMGASEVAIAGVTVGAAMLLMAALGLISWVDRAVPRPVVRGLQMAVACQLLLSGLRLALYDDGSAALRGAWGADGLIVAAGALALTLLLYRRSHWMALGLCALGLVGACVSEPSLLRTAGVSLWRPRLFLLDSTSLAGIWRGGLPQMPLTLLNSVLAVSVLAGRLFPKSTGRAMPRKVAISVGFMNLLTCPFGGMPVCHGSGGLAAQYRFGARSGLSMVMLGFAKLMVGLLFGATALAWMWAFPTSVLGVFLVIAGLGLADASCCWGTQRSLITACVMVVVHLASGLLLLGFVAGWAAYALLPWPGTRPHAASGFSDRARAEPERQVLSLGAEEGS
jgi:hypothetical protein